MAEQLQLESTIREILDSDEPDYERGRTLSPEAIDVLRKFVVGQDVNLAARATYLATLIPSDEVTELVALAARRPEREPRLAAAHGLKNVRNLLIAEVLDKLLNDSDYGVRKFAIKSFRATQVDEVRPTVERIAENDPDTFLRALAQAALEGKDASPEAYLSAGAKD